MVRDEIRKLIKRAVKDSGAKLLASRRAGLDFSVEKPREKIHGDYATNVALMIGKDPMKTVKEIELRIKNYELGIFDKIEIVKPGFINFFLSKEYLQKQIREIKIPKIGKGKKVNIEFISANPTGPLTLGNGRGGFCGDILSNVLEKAGYHVYREFYINDRGKQIEDLKKGFYKGEKRTASQIQKSNQRIITKKLKIKFDNWFSEKSLYKNKEVDKILDYLKKKKLTYQKDKTLWFKSTKFGDDKDRVLIKKDGQYTYLVSDIAYLKNKFNRGFDKLIYFWGADHYGYIDRIKAGAQALGYNRKQIDFIIFQMVRILKKAKLFKMSKRKGIYITLEKLVDEVGLDAVRFFFLQRTANSHLVFNLDLAKKKSQENPVYYVQYAYARISSILKKAKIKPSKNFNLLEKEEELDLIKQLIRFPEIIEDTAKDYQIQRIPQYAIDLAESFHRFYHNCKVITKDKELSSSRLALVLATKIILEETLNLMGISAPQKM